MGVCWIGVERVPTTGYLEHYKVCVECLVFVIGLECVGCRLLLLVVVGVGCC